MTCRSPICVYLTEEKPEGLLLFGGHVSFLHLPPLKRSEGKALWEQELAGLPIAKDVSAEALAGAYVVTAKSVRRIVREAGMRASMRQAAGGMTEVTREDVHAAARAQTPSQLGFLADEIETRYHWDDLVIGDDERRKLELICNQVRYKGVVGEDWGFYEKSAYGNGTCALFYGEPGTGKTMAAHVIANELGLSLYRVDLSRMVSKYVGETQKNISELFDKAKHTNVLLFFDEADALFSKRTEVRDVHDKYANADTAHLLQRLEDYEGLTVLATNYANNIDDAFKRRIRFMIRFVFPDEGVRLRLWKTILPQQAVTDEELDFAFFAKNFEIAGSGIKEVLTNAAYIAAGEGTGIRNAHVEEALKLYFAKLGKVLSGADFAKRR